MGKLFCLMGKSSSGKDTIYKRLLNSEDLHLERIVPYTTRPMRQGEICGVDYHFVDNTEFQHLLESGRVIEHRSYNTVNGVWTYFTVVGDNINVAKSNYIYVCTPDAYHNLKRFFGEDNVVPIMVYVDDGERLQRALNRERTQSCPQYIEMCRRFISDEKDFSSSKMYGVSPFINDNLDVCVNEIKDYIKKVLNDGDICNAVSLA